MGEREALLKKLSAYGFAAFEWNLYLDTHPTDKEGIMMHKRMVAKARELTKEFEEKYGPITAMNAMNDTCFEWLDDPWPWEAI